mmetsp:Transcript_5437/g.7869  ORF Transcript_5437/g.7869 Transcript_5437/m.7869 type:complete len:115 (+) Transcript_5437:363-707(+)
MQSIPQTNETAIFDERKINTSSALSQDCSSSSNDDSSIGASSSDGSSDGRNEKGQLLERRRVHFSKVLDEVYFFQKAQHKDYPHLWYGGHELQKLLDELRLEEKFLLETTEASP